MNNKSLYFISLVALLLPSVTFSMDNPTGAGNSQQNQAQSPNQLKQTMKKLDAYIQTRRLFLRIVELFLDATVDDQAVNWKEVFVELSSCIKPEKLKELDQKYIDLNIFNTLRVKAMSDQTITKQEISSVIKIDKMPELFGYNTDLVCSYIHLKEVYKILVSHYFEKNNYKNLGSALVDHVTIEKLPELIKAGEPQLLTHYFHIGKLLKVIVHDFVKGDIDKRDLAAALKAEPFVALLGIDPKVFSRYVDTQQFMFAVLTIGDAYINDQLDRKKARELGASFLNPTECARLFKIDPETLKKHIQPAAYDAVTKKLLAGIPITKLEFCSIFNTQEIKKSFGISFDNLQNYFDIDEVVKILNDFSTTDLIIKRERILKALNTVRIDYELGFPAGTLESMLDTRLPMGYRQSKFEELCARFDPENRYRAHWAALGALAVTSASFFKGAFCSLSLLKNTCEFLEPQSFLSNFCIALALAGGAVYTGWKTTNPTWRQNVKNNLIFNSFAPRIVQVLLGQPALALELLNHNHPLYKEFTTFAHSLEEEDINTLRPPYILAVAQYNPKLLAGQTRFLKHLENQRQYYAQQPQNMERDRLLRANEQKSMQLNRILEKAEILEHLDTEVPNFQSYYTFINCLKTFEEIRIIGTERLIKGQKDPQELFDELKNSDLIDAEQKQVLKTIVAHSKAIAQLDQTFFNFSKYSQFIESLSLAQLETFTTEIEQHIASRSSDNAYQLTQANPKLLRALPNFIGTLSEEQKKLLAALYN